MAHDHGHAGHSHGVAADADQGRLALALVIIAGFMGVEVVAGLVANSLALLTDAAHMLTDAGAIGLALVATRLAARPRTGRYTFGWKRAEILSAQANGISLLVLAAFLAYEAVGRIASPPEVRGGLVIVVGVIGGLANVAAAAALARAERRSLNVDGAMQHVLADLFGSVAAVVSGVVILATGFGLADPIAALVVVALMVRSGWRLTRDAGQVLLEGAPRGLDVDEIGESMLAVPGVTGLGDLHVWEITSGFPALSAHVLVSSRHDCHERRRALAALLADRFEVTHVTLQVDHGALNGEARFDGCRA